MARRAFKALRSQAIETTRARDPRALGYESYFNHDETRCYAIEQYPDSETTLAHFRNLGQVFAGMMDLARITRTELYGDPSPELARACAPFGAEVLRYWGGYVR